MVVQAPMAQTTSSRGNAACHSNQAAIPATDLPQSVDLKRCPIGERMISDNGIKTALPTPGAGIYIEAMTTDGSQELQVTHYRNGTVKLEHVGNETADAQVEPQVGVAASSPGECSDGAYTDLNLRVEFDLRWYYNRNTTPEELSNKSALSAIRRGTANITDMQSKCRRGD